MATIDLATIDLTPYQTTPLLAADATYRLAIDLHQAMISEAPVHVKKSGKRMLSSATTIGAALTERIEGGGFDLAGEMTFDNSTDHSWSAAREQVEYRMSYAQPGFTLLTPIQQAAIDLPHKRELAGAATRLNNHLFGEDGLAFLRLPLVQQVVAMGTRLTFIATSDEHEVFEEIIGADLLNTLRVMQERYESMVHDRSIRDDTTVNIGQLRRALQRDVTLYAASVLGLLDPDEPELSFEALGSLRPMFNARLAKSSPTNSAAEGADPDPAPEGDDPLPEPDGE